MGAPLIETVYSLAGPTPDDWVPLVLTGGALAVFVVGLPLIQRAIKDEVPDTSRRMVWVLSAIPAACLLMLAAGDAFPLFLGYPRTISEYRAHRYQIVAGCLRGFNPGDGDHTMDTIKVAGRTFSYNSSTIVIGFHQPEADGGPIHADTWVRLYLVGDSIVRIDAAQKACPPAPRALVS